MAADKDVCPGLIQDVNRQFQKNCLKDVDMKKLSEKAQNGTATYADAYRYAESVGSARADAFKSQISSEVLPDGRMYYNIAERLMTDSLTADHDMVAAYAEEVQKAINENAGIHLKAQRADVDKDRIDGFVQRLAREENYDDASWLLNEPVRVHARSVVDDTIKKNAEFHHKAGIKAQVKRDAASDCCKWCDSLVGDYTYPSVPREVFARHDNCRCTLDYNGRRLTAYESKGGKSNTFRDQGEQEKIEGRKRKANGMVMDYKPVIRDVSKAVEIKTREGSISAKPLVNSRNNVFVSDEINLKPRELHRIEQQIDVAKKAAAVSSDVRYVIIPDYELGKATGGRFDPDTNSIYIKVMQDKSEQLYTIVHESFHLKDFENYIAEGNTYADKRSYIMEICEKSKRKLDKLGVNEYNVDKISEYASDMYEKGRFDETLTEYRTVKVLRGK